MPVRKFVQKFTKPVDVKEFLRAIDHFLSDPEGLKSSPPQSTS